MKLRTMGRHFREGSKSVWRNGWMTVSSVGAVTTTLLLVGVFLALMLNLNQITQEVEKDVEIKVLLDRTLQDDQDINRVEKELKSISDVRSVKFSSKEKELEQLIESMGDEGKAFELFDQSNPLKDAFVVKPSDPTETIAVADKIKSIKGVSEVNYGEEIVQRLLQFNEYARTIGLALIIALVFTAIFLISNTIKITIIARKKEIGIMKLVGATNGFIRWPFFIEGMLLGVLGAIIPITAVVSGYYYLYYKLRDKIQFEFIQLLPFDPFAWQLSLLILGIGVFIGIWGSVMSVRKFLKV
ncbi:permease-like cell division protein FtsX [Thalassobacillus devorans]|uniref:permease-like cell division protein FtsX n=1 Tax=Thalassobacillus devorans TaxID=279813 RepID=UPI000491ECC2|nr:permease-like cell division protein FtsX [Thalassobacillus devorans]